MDDGPRNSAPASPGPVRLRRSRHGAADRTYERIPHAWVPQHTAASACGWRERLRLVRACPPHVDFGAEALPDLGCSGDPMDPTARKKPGQATDRDSGSAICLVPSAFSTRHTRTAGTFRPSRPRPLPHAEAGLRSSVCPHLSITRRTAPPSPVPGLHRNCGSARARRPCAIH